MKRIANYGIALTVLLAVSVMAAGAQNQTPSSSQSASSGQSLADYARRARKTPDTGGKPKVFDNDNLPKSDKLSIVGKEAPPEASNQEKPAAAPNATAPGQPQSGAEKTAANSAAKAPEDEATKQAAWKQWSDKIKSQQQQIDLLSRELDVLQREYQIRAAAMYADVGNRLRNQADWDKQDVQYKQQIADKQKAVDEAKQKLEDLQEQARRAGAPASVQEQ